MAGIHLKCQICGDDLKPEPYMDWCVGDRGQRTYFCKRGTYSKDRGGPQHARLEIVVPDNEVYQYELCFEINDRIFQLAGCTNSVVPGRRYPVLSVYQVIAAATDRYHSFSDVFQLDRAYHIDVNKDLNAQCHEIIKKVKTLMVFV